MAAAREKLQTRVRTAAAPNSDHTSVLVLNVCASVCGMCNAYTSVEWEGGRGQVHSISLDKN